MLDHRCYRQPSSKSQPYHVFLLLLSFLLFHNIPTSVRAEANITLDDGDSRIAYSPPGAWTQSAQTQMDYGGSHMLTQNPNATAVFTFTGTAIYFLSPLWPYKVNTAISLDSSPPSLIDLVDHSRPDESQGPETISSTVVWSATSLSDTQHTLRISVGAGQTYAIVDALMYSDPSTSTASPTGRIVADPSYATSSQPSRSKSVVSIVLGVLFGLLGIIAICGAAFYLWRRNKRRPPSEAWTIDGSAYANGTGHGMVPVAGGGGYVNGQGYGSAYGPPSAFGYGPQGQPLPYPPYGYGTYAGPLPTPPYPSVPPNRAPNRYQPGYTLSTITEKSTPQMADGTRTIPGTPMSGAVAAALGAHSPASLQSELGYYTAPGSSVGQYSPPVVAAGQVAQQQQSESQQPQQHRQMGITSQIQVQGPGSAYRK